MSDTPPPKPASPVRKTAVRAAQAGVNVIWLVPIIALVVTLAIAWNAFAERGSLIEVEFADATGVTPGETVLRFREITVGQVESVSFTPDLSKVIVQIRVDKDVAPYIDADAAFWIVRPQVTAQGVTRLDTVLTGSFIEGYWDAQVAQPQTRFVGLVRPPLIREDAKGTWVRLTTDNADGLTEGAPILFHGLEAGRMENLRLDESGQKVIVDAFIEAPYDERLTTQTVFWDTSGFSLSLGTSGLAFNVNSLSSLLQGGVAFDTLVSGGQPIGRDQVYAIQADEDAARNAVFTGEDDNLLRLSILVGDSVRGLQTGAEVQYEGLRVGQVTDLAIDVTKDPSGTTAVRQRVNIAISPARMGLPDGTTADQTLAFLQDAVAKGLRARLAASGFLGATLMVELVEIPGAAPAQIDTAAQPNPIMPSVEGDLEDFTASAQGFMTRIGNLPIEEVLQSATDMMNAVTALAASQDTRAIPESVRAAMQDAQQTLGDIRQMVLDFRQTGAAENAGTALADAREVADKLNQAVERLPQIMDSVQNAATSVRDVDFASIGAQLDAALQEIRDVIGTPQAAALPARIASLIDTLNRTAGQIDRIAGDVQQSGAAANLGKLVDEAAAAAEAVRLAAADVPAMVDQIDATAAAVEKFGFAEVSNQAEGILADLRAMLGSDDAAQLPRNLSKVLASASGLLDDLRDGNAVGSLNDTLRSASVAADEVARSVQQLPQLIQRLQATAGRADAVLGAYGDRSTFNNETIGLLRELRRASEAVGSLARLIERNPRAFILGR